MLTAFGRAFRTPDLRRKLLFTLAMIGLYRLGSVVPGPGVSYVSIQRCLNQVKGDSLYGLVNLFSGGALLQLSVFALGIMPYITSSIIVQLLVVVIPRLETLKDEGQSGQVKLTQYTRYLTVALAILQSTGIVALAPQIEGIENVTFTSYTIGTPVTNLTQANNTFAVIMAMISLKPPTSFVLMLIASTFQPRRSA